MAAVISKDELLNQLRKNLWKFQSQIWSLDTGIAKAEAQV